MRIAAIDIGTNTVLLLVADVDDRGTIHPIAHEQRFPRLGKSVDAQRKILPDGFSSLTEILPQYKSIANEANADIIVACATSAVRDATNKSELIEFLASKTGIQIEVLSGEDEALWTFRGALSGLAIPPREALVIDIGGGSTEITFAQKENSLRRSS
ncbi:MAG TPA: Ppx/GppA family phosphatase, partial [Bacteroidota bacterium]|nr:Ppx/GppA family phosphatase [Bacteroidota bacterium]